ncbi:MAG: acylphosphatase [Chloroflexota bacterium]
MKPPVETVRAHIWVRGRVQGVGFRAFVQQTAMLIGVAGWVRNVGYDTVEALAEGEREKVERFLQAVKRGPRMSLVEEAREEWETATGEFGSFEVRRSA